MSSTIDFIRQLESLRPCELVLLRSFAGRSIDESVEVFDLFAGLWWNLRKKDPKAPRREVAWLIAKLYAMFPLKQAEDKELPAMMSELYYRDSKAKLRLDLMLLITDINRLETHLQWCFRQTKPKKINWVKLTDQLSQWENQTTRQYWAKQIIYTQLQKGKQPC